jgi:ribonuclease D
MRADLSYTALLQCSNTNLVQIQLISPIIIYMDNLSIFDVDLSLEQLEYYSMAEAIAVDTETMGLILGRDRLCLIQLCDPKGTVSVIKVAKGQTGAPNLKKLMESPKITKLFHFARFDVAQLTSQLSIYTKPIFCTKIASKLVRTYTNSHGLKTLVQELEGIELDKSSQCSDWGNTANLSREQLAYASNDVLHLHGLRAKLTTMLDREGLLDLANSCFNCLPTIVELDMLRYPNIFDH